MDASTASLHVTGIAVGGDGVARDPDGQVILVSGALPGETVTASFTGERRGVARAEVTGVVEAAPERVTPPCPFVAQGCGGCGWQHVTPAGQSDLRAAMVTDALVRLGGLVEPTVRQGPALPATGYRTTLRGVADDEGLVALRRHHSHDLVAVPGCQVAHPLVVEVLAEGRFPPGAAVTVRAGARTGERLVVVEGPDGPAEDADASADDDWADTAVPDGVRVVTLAELEAGKRAWIHEVVDGARLRLSALSFFQAGPDGAEALTATVRHALGDALAGSDGRPAHLVDLYGGIGLFAATVGGPAGARVTVVETSPSACADARVNLAGMDARVVRTDVARWRPRRADAMVADPPRAGLGKDGVRAVVGARVPRLVLVSCDAGALGRDAALLAAAGYAFVDATLVDQFAGTPHVEVVSRFDLSGG